MQASVNTFISGNNDISTNIDVSDNINQIRIINKDKVGHLIIIQLIQQEDNAVVALHAPNNRFSKYIKQ